MVRFMDEHPEVSACGPKLLNADGSVQHCIRSFAGAGVFLLQALRSRDNRIIFGAPLIGEAEAIAVADCIRSGWIGLGERVGRFEQEFAAYKNAPHAAAVSSCSAGLHLVLLALGIGPGDEVIAPSLTFCSTIHAILHVGATPVLVDSELASRNIAPDAIERAITPQTKAVIAVHMCGRACEMDAILELADRYHLRVVEDCAHAIETTYRGREAGMLGDAGCFSFYPTKSITTGDGGMVISRYQSLIEQVKLLSYNGVATSAWKRFTGDVAGYEVRAAGYKYNMTDMEAALGLPQLRLLEERWARRRHLWHLYDGKLKELPLLPPAVGHSENRHAYHLYAPMLNSLEVSVNRDQIVARWRPRTLASASTTNLSTRSHSLRSDSAGSPNLVLQRRSVCAPSHCR
jgi:dTDP-4-amino-4,6-dideoxygalactose transaminase